MLFPLPIAAATAAINHVLAAEPWARSKLARHGGKIACFDGGVALVRLLVNADGSVSAAPEAGDADVTIRMKLSDLPLIVQNRERAFSYVRIEGDADFANAISQVSQGVRWDAEEDLSRVVGDIAARRLVSGARSVHGMVMATGRSVAENLAEYFLDERPTLVRPLNIHEFTGEVARLRDDAERLAKRIEKLKGSLA
ncbi:MAG: ubiquinone biosynthesis accessory factor UbiJ [Janthinobacterium lividum]